MGSKRRASTKDADKPAKKGSEAASRRNNAPQNQNEAPTPKTKARKALPKIDPLDTTCDIDYLKVYNSELFPWFMEGVRALQQDSVSYPAKSHGLDRQLADIHRTHPRLAFGFIDADDDCKAFPMLTYESAGLWEDDEKEVCLVVKPKFEDGEDGMLLLYKSNLVENEEDIKEECQWCVLQGKGGKSKKRKTK